MVKSALAEARSLNDQGLQVFPAKKGQKSPLVEWKTLQSEPVAPYLEKWFGGKEADEINYWVLCGSMSKIVILDCDNDLALDYWKHKLGDVLDKTTCVRSGKGYHFYFRLEPGQKVRTWAIQEADGVAFEVRGDRTGTIVPPSLHPNGRRYQWLRGLEHLQPAPPVLLGPSTAARHRDTGAGAMGARSVLSGLLHEPPSGPDSGRNIWLTRVAGHYAKWIPYRDAFETTIRTINDSLTDPLPDEEVTKTIESIWSSEHDEEKDQEPIEENGWLIGHSNKLWTAVRMKDGSSVLMPYSNFDIRCMGVIEDEEGHRSYSVEIRTENRKIHDLLEYGTLGVFQKLTVWLAGHGVNIIPPPGDHRGQMMARLQRYLESQGAPQAKATPYLGWVEGSGFVAHEGVITKDGLQEHGEIRPHPKLRGWAHYSYGFVSEEEARDVLNEVLTFQEEQLTSVFGAWWAACWLKGQTAFGTSLFPYVALEAPSESGKTRGFFSLMMQLNGNRMGHGEATTAALRDQVGSHRNGIVWIDDLSDVATVADILRQATSEGVRTKKGIDRLSQESVRLVAPLVVSGESLGSILTEKAQRDRAVQLTAHSPVNRKSFRGDYPQWDDVEDLLRRYDRDLTRVAGTLCQMALQQHRLVDLVRSLRGSAGRHHDKVGILRVGARVLAALTGDEKHLRIVDDWCEHQVDLGSENVLTTHYLPTLLREHFFPESPKGHPPVFVREGVVYFSEEKVADEWKRKYRAGERASLASVESLRMQRRELGVEGEGKRFSILNNRSKGMVDKQVRFHQLSPALSAQVLERAGLGPSAVAKNGHDALTGVLSAGGVSGGVSTGEVQTPVWKSKWEEVRGE